jgi:hypothetical protein
LRLEISVQDSELMAMSNTLQELIHETLDNNGLKRFIARIHKLLQVLINILEDEN